MMPSLELDVPTVRRLEPFKIFPSTIFKQFVMVSGVFITKSPNDLSIVILSMVEEAPSIF